MVNLSRGTKAGEINSGTATSAGAITDFTEAIRLDPTNAEAYTLPGVGLCA